MKTKTIIAALALITTITLTTVQALANPTTTGVQINFEAGTNSTNLITAAVKSVENGYFAILPQGWGASYEYAINLNSGTPTDVTASINGPYFVVETPQGPSYSMLFTTASQCTTVLNGLTTGSTYTVTLQVSQVVAGMDRVNCRVSQQ